MRAATVLVVEDDRRYADFVAHVARQDGYEVRFATSAEELWEQLDADVDLLLLDLGLPGTDGLAILRDLAMRSCGASIHVLSGADGKLLRSATRLAAELGLRVGDPLAKPVAVDDLRRVLAASRSSPERPRQPLAPGAAEFGLTTADLRGGLERDELFVVFQPIVELATLEPIGVEALVRWRHPEHGILAPVHFVPLAESSELIHELTREVLDQGVRFARRDSVARRPRPLTVSVNLSPMVLTDLQFPIFVDGLLASGDLDPARFVFEVTESAALANRLNVLEVLSRLRLRGIELSIDDFGTGSSSLERLDQLPCSELKIERLFTSQVLRQSEAREIVRHTIDLAHRFGLRTVAEGIEDPGVLEWLREAGCDMGQGFLFSRGLEPDDFDLWLAGWSDRRENRWREQEA